MQKHLKLFQKKGTASFQLGLGDFSDLSNECKRSVPRIFGHSNFLHNLNAKVFLFEIGFQYLTRGLTAFEILFERKPKNPI
ncbi:hypothetical protein [Cecembia rubra]|uniref:hypothetical protein n=1 Tax=Cecembia rubra TaxID=1485585 RepID=UPI0011B25F62|nr:hypothetical protein [Cecembia rubra]